MTISTFQLMELLLILCVVKVSCYTILLLIIVDHIVDNGVIRHSENGKLFKSRSSFHIIKMLITRDAGKAKGQGGRLEKLFPAT